MGTPDFAVPSLTRLLDAGCDVRAVVTAPDKPRGRGQHMTPTPVGLLASSRGIPVLQPVSLKDPAFAAHLATVSPDLIVVVAFRVLPAGVFTLARLGTFNLHASLLPKYRGAAPINRAIMNGESESGVTTFLLKEKVDTGNVLLQERVPVGDDDDAGVLHDRLAVIGADLVLRTVRLLETGNATPRPQDDRLASPAPRIFREDCRIVWTRSAVEIRNQIRGLSPHPAAFTTHAGRVLKLFKCRLGSGSAAVSPGSVRTDGRTLAAATGNGWLEILELQLEGKKRLGIGEFLRGYRIRDGEMLGEGEPLS